MRGESRESVCELKIVGGQMLAKVKTRINCHPLTGALFFVEISNSKLSSISPKLATVALPFCWINLMQHMSSN